MATSETDYADPGNLRSRRLKLTLVGLPVVGSLAALVIRYRRALRLSPPRQTRIFKWLFSSRETTNFTYELVPRNRRYLAAFIAEITAHPQEEIESYFRELENDDELQAHIKARIESDPVRRKVTDKAFRPGRRLGWYAAVRALKPRVVVETGVDKGLGTVILSAALRRNASEGHEGHHYGTDINPAAGLLLAEPYSERARILVGDSIASLQEFEQTIDLLVNDSDHSSAYEAREYVTVRDKLSDNALILGDNSHLTDELLKFALQTNRQFLFFAEEPQDHWYPGAGLGAAFRSGRGQ